MSYFSSKLLHTFDGMLKDADRLKNELHFVTREGSDFSRKARKLSFKDTIRCILSMSGKPIREELLDFFDYGKHTPTASAFVQARPKITPYAFHFLFDEINKSFPSSLTHKGYRLIPIDKNDMDTLYTSGSKGKHLSSYHINASYDILNHRYVDMIIQGIYSLNEMEAMWTMASRFHENKTIFIADRNYATWNNMAYIMNSDRYFLIRSKDIHSHTGILKKFNFPDEEFDEDICISLTTKHTKEIRMHPESYRLLSTTSTFDFLDELYPYFTMRFRVVRFNLGNREGYESIATNLDRERFCTADIKELYHQQWGIEISFRHLKYSANLFAIHAKKRLNIQQEIWARMILYNMSFILIMHVENEKINNKDRKTEYKYAINITRRFIIAVIIYDGVKEKAGFRLILKPPFQMKYCRFAPIASFVEMCVHNLLCALTIAFHKSNFIITLF